MKIIAWIKRTSLPFKLTTIILVISVSTLLLSGALILTSNYMTAREHLISDIETLAAVTAHNSTSAILFEDISAIKDVLVALSRDKNIRAAKMFNIEKVALGSFNSKNNIVSNASTTDTEFLLDNYELMPEIHTLVTNNSLIVNYPVTLNNEQIGTLLIHASLDILRKQQWQSASLLLIVFLISILIALALSLVFQRIISNPVRNLITLMDEVSEKNDFSLRANKEREDELGLLANGLNDMLEQISARDRRLSSQQTYLQQEVDRQTEELIDVNRALEQTIAQLEKAMQAADTANQTKSQFLANMSHEIRTPMHGVLGMAELLKTTELSEKQREYVQTVQRSGRNLLAIINDILDISKIEAGKFELEQIEFDLLLEISKTIDLIQPEADRKNLELGYVIDADVPRILIGDPTRLCQVILNLLSNAVKFTEHGYVTLVIRHELDLKQQTQLVCTVADSGIGVSIEQHQRIFDLFSQADNSISREYGGTGLGLAICRNLVKLMGGTITVRQNEPQGSIFEFSCFLKVSDSRSTAEKTTTLANTVQVLFLGQNHRTLYMLQQWCARLQTHFAYLQHIDPHSVKQLQTHTLRAPLVFFEFNVDKSELPPSERWQPPILDRQNSPVTYIGCTAAIKSLLKRQPNLTTLTLPLHYNQLLEHLDRYPSYPHTRLSTHTTLLDLEKISAHVLVAEDNPVNQTLVAELLSVIGCTCTVVDNGKDAVDAYLTGHYDVILMDCQMPVLDGYAATRTIREWEAETNSSSAESIPIIALTANVLEEGRDACLNAGMNDHIGKPFSITELSRKLKYWLKKNPSQSETILPTLDWEVVGTLKELQNATDINSFNHLTKIYIPHSQKIVNCIIHQAATDQLEELSKSAHSLKSSSAHVGALKLADICNTLELNVFKLGESERNNLVQQLESEHTRVLEALSHAT